MKILKGTHPKGFNEILNFEFDTILENSDEGIMVSNGEEMVQIILSDEEREAIKKAL